MSIKQQLSEKAKETQKEVKRMQGQLQGISKDWPAIVDDYCQSVYEKASLGEEKLFFDMQHYNQATITKISVELKTRLGDVLVIVSPRGIEANWEMQD
jgi:hypothetical protein